LSGSLYREPLPNDVGPALSTLCCSLPSGRVGLRLVDPGNLVTANATTALVVITQLHPITVIFTLAEDSFSQALGQMSDGRQFTVYSLTRL